MLAQLAQGAEQRLLFCVVATRRVVRSQEDSKGEESPSSR